MEESTKKTNEKIHFAKIFCIVLFAFFVAFYYSPNLETLKDEPLENSTFSVLSENSGIAHDMVALRDSQPIFLPTKWNFSAPEFKIISQSQTLEVRKIDSPELAKKAFELEFSNMGKPIALESIKRKDSIFSSFKRTDFKPKKMSQSGQVNISMKSLASGEDVFFGKMSPSANYEGVLWQPVEISVFVDSLGEMSEPFVASGSGLESLDLELARYVKTKLSNKILKKGAYKIIFAP